MYKVICLLLLFEVNCYTQNNFSKLTGPYLGQKPPGMKPEMFAPKLLSFAGSSELNISFSPDGNEFCYSLITDGEGSQLSKPGSPFLHRYIFYSQLKSGKWTEPIEYPYIPNHLQWLPNFSPDGNRIYFNSKRTDVDPDEISSPYIWYIERKDKGWSNPVEIDFGPDYRGWTGVFPTVAANGNLYFTLFPDRQRGYIYKSEPKNNRYRFPEKISDTINKDGGNHPFIAPDESYLLFDRNGDLFISFRSLGGEWLEPENLGNSVNTKYMERRPFVSFDSKFLFFSSNRINQIPVEKALSLSELRNLTDFPQNGFQHIYWVDAKIIEQLKPEHLKQ